jgi:hydrogenase maturation protease
MSGCDRPLVLVVGIGNPDRGDDGVGPAIAHRLSRRIPPGVGVLKCAGDVLTLIMDWEGVTSVILVDATAPITQPGRVHRLDVAKNPLPIDFARPSTHSFGLAETVELARSLGTLPASVVAYLIEGEQFESGASLSPAVARAVDEVVEQICLDFSSILGTSQA